MILVSDVRPPKHLEMKMNVPLGAMPETKDYELTLFNQYLIKTQYLPTRNFAVTLDL